MNAPESQTNGVSNVVPHEHEWEQIQEALRGLRFGSINIIVQDSVVVQIDRTEKRRLRFSGNESSKTPRQQRAC